MSCRRLSIVAIIVAAAAGPPFAGRGAETDMPFPSYRVRVEQDRMDLLVDLLRAHTVGIGPGSSLWDEWMSLSTLWPATSETDAKWRRWRDALLNRRMDPEGYVATHQHPSIAHQDGWPFPFWRQAQGTWGWHFSLSGVPDGWHNTSVRDAEGWGLEGCADDGIRDPEGWRIRIEESPARVTAPEVKIDSEVAPFLQMRWDPAGLGDNGRAAIEWTTEDLPGFGPDRRFEIPRTSSAGTRTAMLPLYRHPGWEGTVTGLRIVVVDAEKDGRFSVQALFTQFDTRHPVNNPCFVIASDRYFRTTGDTEFLRRQAPRLRAAMQWLWNDASLAREGIVVAPFPGHDGRAGFTPGADLGDRIRAGDPPRDAIEHDRGKQMHPGHGIGNNYWDLLPFGHRDAYATMLAYVATLRMADLERAIRDHPGWNVPTAERVPWADPDELTRLAERVRDTAQRVFWNDETGRFVACIDADGVAHDYGFTFLNLEMIHYGIASATQAESILDWVEGRRVVDGDTSTGADIYHWTFAPRATTRRNLDWYGWYWNGPETIPWGGQVQDGGAVLGFSYHDVSARLKVRGPDNARARLAAILDWYRDVVDAGGYRAYYAGGRDGATLQGGGTAGGLGLDKEFVESALLPQIVPFGFLGYRPGYDGFEIAPNLPTSWPSLAVDGIRYRSLALDVEADRGLVRIRYRGGPAPPLVVTVPEAVAFEHFDTGASHPDAVGQILDQGEMADGQATVVPAASGEILIRRGTHRPPEARPPA